MYDCPCLSLVVFTPNYFRGNILWSVISSSGSHLRHHPDFLGSVGVHTLLCSFDYWSGLLWVCRAELFCLGFCLVEFPDRYFLLPWKSSFYSCLFNKWGGTLLKWWCSPVSLVILGDPVFILDWLKIFGEEIRDFCVETKLRSVCSNTWSLTNCALCVLGLA